ncbi:MAG: hypothetical protein HYU31_11200 [Deltaproteobacteria bacterium]|nr:hypothetical protein [Deltaproteobacteria bacterium]
MSQKCEKIPYGSKLPVYFFEEELRLIRERTLVHTDFGRLAVAERGKLKLELSLDDIEEVQGYIAAEANHTRSKKVQREMDMVYEKLQKFLDDFDDQDE